MVFGKEYTNHESTQYTNPSRFLLAYFLHISPVRKLG